MWVLSLKVTSAGEVCGDAVLMSLEISPGSTGVVPDRCLDKGAVHVLVAGLEGGFCTCSVEILGPGSDKCGLTARNLEIDD